LFILQASSNNNSTLNCNHVTYAGLFLTEILCGILSCKIKTKSSYVTNFFCGFDLWTSYLQGISSTGYTSSITRWDHERSSRPY